MKMKKPGESKKAEDLRAQDQDRRKHLRAALPLKARFLDENRQERPCLIVNISAGGALLRAKSAPAAGEKIVLYVDQVGRFEADVIRSDNQTFAVSYEKRRAGNAKTADNLTEIMNRGPRATDRRKNPRIEQDATTTVRLEDGNLRECAILDISLTGASLEISPRPPLGTRVVLGRTTAKVVRRHDKGVGVVFTGPSERMEDVIAETSAQTEPPEVIGAPFAPKFGKKGPRD